MMDSPLIRMSREQHVRIWLVQPQASGGHSAGIPDLRSRRRAFQLDALRTAQGQL
jgi:hypothetical protein